MSCILLCLFRIVVASHLFCSSSASNGFRSKLVYRDSPYSPLYRPNLSHLEAFWRDIKTSRSRASDLMSLTKSETNGSNVVRGDALQLSLFFREPLFTLELGIGTPTTKARLVFDTAAPLTWTQCQPCTRCFRQDYPVFDPRNSTSFRKMPPNHTLLPWLGCPNPECHYYVSTSDGAWSQGILSIDSFSFPGTSGELRNIVFGCGNRNNRGLRGGRKMMFTGLLGMGNYPTSLVHQLGDRVLHRFSYCLPSLRSSKTKRSDLSFGEAAVVNGENVQITRLLPRRQGPLLVRSSYRLNLLGISLAGKRLEIPDISFQKGCIIDTGTPLSIIDQNAYKLLPNAISSYFSQYKKIKPIANRKYPRNVCYKYPRGFRNFPNMIFHFEGANLEIAGTSLFMFGRDLSLSNFICLQMLGEPVDTNILGVYQQQNIRFLYDLGNNKLSFPRENC